MIVKFWRFIHIIMDKIVLYFKELNIIKNSTIKIGTWYFILILGSSIITAVLLFIPFIVMANKLPKTLLAISIIIVITILYLIFVSGFILIISEIIMMYILIIIAHILKYYGYYEYPYEPLPVIDILIAYDRNENIEFNRNELYDVNVLTIVNEYAK